MTAPEQDPISSSVDTRVESPQKIGIKAWPSVGLPEWRRWGFQPTDVIRTPPGHFFLNPRESSIYESISDGPALILKGEWYRMDERREQIMQKSVWIVYALGLILFACMLMAVSVKSGFGALAIFILMYLLLEGFPIFSLRRLLSDSRFTEKSMPYDLLGRGVYLEREGIILLQWDLDASREGLAIRMTPSASERLVKSLENFHRGKGIVQRFKNETLNHPPSNQQR